jgi:hypothetical protein
LKQERKRVRKALEREEYRENFLACQRGVEALLERGAIAQETIAMAINGQYKHMDPDLDVFIA